MDTDLNRKGFFIYGLFDPQGELRYVGQTTRTLSKRLEGHLTPSKLTYDHRSNWIRSLLKNGQKPIIQKIQEFNIKEDLDLAEIYWIKYFRDAGCRLTNDADGGNGSSGHKHSEETRKKIAEGGKGRQVSPETRAKISAKLMGHSFSIETIEKIKETKRNSEYKGRPYTEEDKLAASIRMKGIGKGRKLSEEHKQHIAEGLKRVGFVSNGFKKGHKRTPEMIEKHRLAMTGRPKSEEHKRKVGLANRIPLKDQFGNIYNGFPDVEEKLKISFTSIYRSINENKLVKGYQFYYIEKEENQNGRL